MRQCQFRRSSHHALDLFHLGSQVGLDLSQLRHLCTDLGVHQLHVLPASKELVTDIWCVWLLDVADFVKLLLVHLAERFQLEFVLLDRLYVLGLLWLLQTTSRWGLGPLGLVSPAVLLGLFSLLLALLSHL